MSQVVACDTRIALVIRSRTREGFC
ncbi:uncharacterized protein METZ01_LOCUS78823 [marine metagenome]|uniref:Uncharacterized protein n=1 Tax=marine metagenome TaxID=408172 RepID=A0A381UCV0_9ZZZZ